MTVAIATTLHPVYPPRVVIAVTGLTVGDVVDVYRSVAGNRTLLRGGSTDSAPDTAMRVVDAELPYGIPVTHIATVNGTDVSTSATTYTLTGGKIALSDAITGLAAEVVILAAGQLTRTRDAARFRVGGRNIVVSRPLSARAGAYDLFLETTTAYDNLMTLLAQATEGIVQLRQPGGYDGFDAYLAVDNLTEERWSQDGSDQRRVVTIEFAEVDAWPDELNATAFTYDQVETYYSGLTYADAEGDFATYIEATVADYS
ncbi:MAG TPA: hypothetical protein VFM50_02880 [Nocardioidaceae bacterium]|nr:hypothetical protein [Nocardioidaceae bacterium]